MSPAPRSVEVRLRRVSPTHHRLSVVRGVRVEDERELETRSTLRHDLVHFAVETAAQLDCGFFGRLAAGVGYAALTADTPQAQPVAMAVERVVAALQSAGRGDVDAPAFVARMADYHRSLGELPPTWLDATVVQRAVATLRQLEGRWRGTAFGDVMTLVFP